MASAAMNQIVDAKNLVVGWPILKCALHFNPDIFLLGYSSSEL